MANIYTVENTKLGRQGIQTKDESGNWVAFHCQQERLDGACAENGRYPPTQNGDIRSLFMLFTLLAMQN